MDVHFYVPRAEDQEERDAVYHRMREEGLLPAVMHAMAEPSLEDWRRVSNAERAWLLLGRDKAGDLLGAALLTPWRGRVWEFDFTIFRAHFAKAVEISRATLPWIFAHAPCDSLVGLCPQHNRHAWRLAEAAGFTVLGRVPGACWWAARGAFVDGVLVMASAG